MCAFVNSRTFRGKDWTEECQGVTTDGVYWYISSNNPDKRGIYRMDDAMGTSVYFDVGVANCDHIGDLDYFEGNLYCAMEKPQRVVVVSTADFGVPGAVPMVASRKDETGKGIAPQGDKKMPWCTINPRNGMLYSSQFGSDASPVRRVFAYKWDGATGNFCNVPREDIILDTASVSIQGGCFKDDCLLLASDVEADRRIVLFRIGNATVTGYSAKKIRSELVDDRRTGHRELEGPAYRADYRYGNGTSDVHVIVLDNDLARDDVIFKHHKLDWP